MNKLFIDNESYNIEEDNITISQIKRKIYVNGKLISETNKDSVHISFTGNSVKVNIPDLLVCNRQGLIAQ